MGSQNKMITVNSMMIISKKDNEENWQFSICRWECSRLPRWSHTPVGVQILMEVLKKYLFRSLLTEKSPTHLWVGLFSMMFAFGKWCWLRQWWRLRLMMCACGHIRANIASLRVKRATSFWAKRKTSYRHRRCIIISPQFPANALQSPRFYATLISKGGGDFMIQFMVTFDNKETIFLTLRAVPNCQTNISNGQKSIAQRLLTSVK